MYHILPCRLCDKRKESFVKSQTVAVSYSIASIDPHWHREVKTYTSVNCVQWFLRDMQCVSKEIRDIYQQLMPIKKFTAEEELCHILVVKCFLCRRHFHESDDLSKKQTDHCHITGQYRGSTCKYCNLKNLSLTGIPIPIVLHSFSGYDSKLIMQHVQDLNITVIANSTEKIKCAKIFVDNIPIDSDVDNSVSKNNVFIDASARS